MWVSIAEKVFKVRRQRSRSDQLSYNGGGKRFDSYVTPCGKQTLGAFTVCEIPGRRRWTGRVAQYLDALVGLVDCHRKRIKLEFQVINRFDGVAFFVVFLRLKIMTAHSSWLWHISCLSSVTFWSSTDDIVITRVMCYVFMKEYTQCKHFMTMTIRSSWLWCISCLSSLTVDLSESRSYWPYTLNHKKVAIHFWA